MNYSMTKDGEFPLKLNLQYFAEGDEPDNPEPGDEPDKPDDNPDKPKGEEGGDEPSPDDDKKFTQKELDEILAERLKRERRKQEEEQERQRKEEQGQYKDLLEQEREEFRKFKREITVKDLMLNEGYDLSQVERYAKFVDGEDEETISTSIAELREDVKPKTAEKTDPSPGPSSKKKPQQSDGKDDSIERFKALKAKGKIK